MEEGQKPPTRPNNHQREKKIRIRFSERAFVGLLTSALLFHLFFFLVRTWNRTSHKAIDVGRQAPVQYRHSIGFPLPKSNVTLENSGSNVTSEDVDLSDRNSKDGKLIHLRKAISSFFQKPTALDSTMAESPEDVLNAENIGTLVKCPEDCAEDEADMIIRKLNFGRKKRAQLSIEESRINVTTWVNESFGDLREVQRSGSQLFQGVQLPETKEILSPPNPEIDRSIPLVTIFAKQTNGPCKPSYFVYKNLKIALKHNSPVHLIGPKSWSKIALKGVIFENWKSYRQVFKNFQSKIGLPIPKHVRWYVLLEFMKRHKYKEVFYFEPEYGIFANVTEFALQHLKPHERHIMLLQSERFTPFGPNLHMEGGRTTASGSVSLWSREGLEDFLKFHKLFFKMDVLNGRPATKFLVELSDYSDEVVLGWYSLHLCWTQPHNYHCKAEPEIGIISERIHRLEGKFTPLFNVSSALKVHQCEKTDWSKQGSCTFSTLFLSKDASAGNEFPSINSVESLIGERLSTNLQLLAARTQKISSWSH